MGTIKDWYEDEKKYTSLCVGAIVIGVIGSVLFYVFHKGFPIYPDIMIALAVLLFFLRYKYHFIEIRLYKFYEIYYNSLTPGIKSLDEYLSIMYLNLFLLMCLSFFNFTVFLVLYTLFMMVDQFFNVFYLRYQRKYKQDWSSGLVNAERLFKNWVIMNYIDVLLGVTAFVLSLFVSNSCIWFYWNYFYNRDYSRLLYCK
jgi:hypothetical protein